MIQSTLMGLMMITYLETLCNMIVLKSGFMTVLVMLIHKEVVVQI